MTTRPSAEVAGETEGAEAAAVVAWGLLRSRGLRYSSLDAKQVMSSVEVSLDLPE